MTAEYIAQTFGWMFVGLMITFALAVALAYTGEVFYLFSILGIQDILFWCLLRSLGRNSRS